MLVKDKVEDVCDESLSFRREIIRKGVIILKGGQYLLQTSKTFEKQQIKEPLHKRSSKGSKGRRMLSHFFYENQSSNGIQITFSGL